LESGGLLPTVSGSANCRIDRWLRLGNGTSVASAWFIPLSVTKLQGSVLQLEIVRLFIEALYLCPCHVVSTSASLKTHAAVALIHTSRCLVLMLFDSTPDYLGRLRSIEHCQQSV